MFSSHALSRACVAAALASTCLAVGVARAAPAVTVDAASPTAGADAVRPGYGAPQGTFRPFATSADLASPANGFARPAVAKDVIAGYPDIHAAAFVNDGNYGNGSSWIGASPDGWVKIDLGRVVLVDGVRLGRDRTGGLDDRDPGALVVQLGKSDDVYADGDESNDATEYATVFDSATTAFSGQIDGAQTLRATFTPTVARYVKVRVGAAGAALDEIEVSGMADAFGCVVSPCGPDSVCENLPEPGTRSCTCAPNFKPVDGACVMIAPVTVTVAYVGASTSANARMLSALAQRFALISGGLVKLSVVPLGAVANELTAVQKIRANTYHGALLTDFGAFALVREMVALAAPGLIRTAAERDQVLAAVSPTIEAAADKAGYAVLAWGELGPARVFSTTARTTVADLQKAKLAVAVGNVFRDAILALGILGALEFADPDLLPALQTGTIDATTLPAAKAVATTVTAKARVASDLVWSWVDEALVVRKDRWLMVSQDLRTKLLAAAKDVGAQEVRDARSEDASALVKLKAGGGQVAAFTEAAAWYALDEQSYAQKWRGAIVPAALFDAVVERVRAVRGAAP